LAPQAKAALQRCFEALSTAYLEGVRFEGVEERAATLLPGLLLARVDGKSPVEYLTQERQKQQVRDFAKRFLQDPAATLQPIGNAWQESLT
jgi:hypothetical protein